MLIIVGKGNRKLMTMARGDGVQDDNEDEDDDDGAIMITT